MEGTKVEEKMGNTVFGIICFILALVFQRLNLPYLYVQFLLLGIWRGLMNPVQICREELLVTGYPEEKCKSIEKYGVLFWEEYKKKLKMPIEIIQMVLVNTGGVIFFSVLLWTIGKNFLNVVEILFLGYVFFGLFVDFIFLRKAYRIAFYTKFKRVTIHNWKYLFGCSRFKVPPKRVKMGKCIVVQEQTKYRRSYYIVQLKKSKNIYEKVMYCGEGVCDKNREHTLYEIFGVKYIM